MRELKLADQTITEPDIFVIAELGSNHMGDPDLCEKMILEAANCGVSAIKMQKRDNRAMFTKSAYSRPYDNELSYGKTYGEHREHLDWFGYKEFARFKRLTESLGMIFFATPFEPSSADFLLNLDIPLFKVASCDVSNWPLVEHIASFGRPMLISTGGCAEQDLIDLHKKLGVINKNYAVLHCISTYPNEDSQLNLRVITRLGEIFQHHIIGFSSHHPGLLPIYLARLAGATIFEVHFTLNRGFRGTDHGFSMEPAGLKKICADLRRIEPMMGNPTKTVLEAEKGGFITKMGKGIYLNRPKKAGEIVQKTDISIKSPYQNGLKPSEIGQIDGKVLVNDVSTGVPLQKEDFYD